MMKQLKRILIVALSVLLLVSGSVSAATVGEAKKNIWSTYTRALEAEKARDFDTARSAYDDFIHYATVLEQEAGESHWENIKGFTALKNHLTGTPELYVEASLPQDSVYYGAKHEPKYGTYFGKCDQFYPGRESAFLLYVTFGTESVKTFSYMLPDETGGYLELAWNVARENRESLEEILSGRYDAYIIENLTYMNSLDFRVLLRFGAEVNCWVLPETEPELSAFIETYKAAFRKIATMARKYAPNVAMVYSPNDVSNWLVTAEDFYPGDEYVDWVGLSMYDNLVPTASFQPADPNDAYFCRGLYDNPIARLRPVVEAFGDRKPIMVSECGFSYGGDGLQTEAHAVAQFEQFYSYVNVVYPQVKAVFYFNADITGRHKLDGSPALRAMYEKKTAENAGMAASVTGKQRGYTRFETVSEHTDNLKISMYAALPTGQSSDVAYTLDGAGIPHSGRVPYAATIPVTGLAQGRHVLTAAVSNGGYYKSRDYVFYVGPDNFVTTSYAAYENAVANRPDIKVTLNGELLSFPQAPILYDGNTLVPLRVIFEALSADVSWDGTTQTVTAKRDGTTISLAIDGA
ncbi:MAG: hypothetical protein IJO50_00225, partial [Clostridia bacterium]|nr:hypothetical protein [Clostridia bacterium]